MKAQELRINNRVKQGTIKSFYEKGAHFGYGKFIDYDKIKPIPLTDEWLVKFGFEKEDKKPSKEHGYYYSKHIEDYKYCFSYANFRGDWGFYNEYTDSPIDFDDDRKYIVSFGVKYVHQLQNLIFALIGKELDYDKKI